MTILRGNALNLIQHWLKFNVVGALGICVQLLAVFFFGSVLKVNSLCATALAVEVAAHHNVFWHRHFTWCDHRVETLTDFFRCVSAFYATTEAISIAGNMFAVSRPSRGGTRRCSKQTCWPSPLAP